MLGYSSRFQAVLRVTLVALAAAPQGARLSRFDISHNAERDCWPFGSSVRVIGDLDGDGWSEFAVGQPYSQRPYAGRGRVFLYSGVTREVVHVWKGEEHEEHFGLSLAAGDVNGDGVPDVLVGAPGMENEQGSVRAYSGTTFEEIVRFGSGCRGDDFGWSVVLADVMNDESLEVVIGAPSWGLGTGAVFVFDLAGKIRAQECGSQPGSRFGWSLATGADFERDGKEELVVGAPWESNTGRASVYSVPDWSELSRLFGGQPGDQFGFSLAVVPDPFAPRLAVGAPGRDGKHVDEGVVTLFFGYGPEAELQWSGCNTSSLRWFEEPLFRGDPTRVPRDPERDLWRAEGESSSHIGCQLGMRFGHALLALPSHDDRRIPELVISAPYGYSGWGCPSGWLCVVPINSGHLGRQSGSLPIWGYGWSLDAFPANEPEAALLVGAPGDCFFTGSMVDVRPTRVVDHRDKRAIHSVQLPPGER